MCGGVSALHTMHLHLPELIDLPRCIRTSAVSAATYLAPSIRVGGRAGLSAARLVRHGNSAHPSRGWGGPGPLSRAYVNAWVSHGSHPAEPRGWLPPAVPPLTQA